MLYREPKLLKDNSALLRVGRNDVSVLYREPKLLKGYSGDRIDANTDVSVLYREPKLLKDDFVIDPFAE